MDEKYLLLVKHFMGETTPAEEDKITEYKKSNDAEYKALKQFWLSKGEIQLIDFDTQKAFEKVKNRVENSKQATVIDFKSRLKRITAAAAILILIALGLYFMLNRIFSQPEILVADNINVSGGKIVNLTDGSVVYLNKNASLAYPEKFTGDRREVILTGEAFFDIAKDKKHPFVIKVQKTEVTVLGTSFNINSDSLQTSVTVATGKVNVKSLQLNKSVNIEPGQSAKITVDSLIKSPTTNPNYLSWKTGLFTFDNTSISLVIKDLNTYYNNKIILDSSNIDCKITANFDKKSIDEIVQILELTCDIKLQIKQ